MNVAAVRHLTTEELEAGLDAVLASPKDRGPVRLIVRRPAAGEREVLTEGHLDPEVGLVGDSWRARCKGTPDPYTQLTLMSSRVVALLAAVPERWALAGDQLFVDIDLSSGNLPPGTRLSVGTAIIEVSSVPHLGCKKFSERFGVDALAFISTAPRKELNFRGINARVIQAGVVRSGDVVTKLPMT